MYYGILDLCPDVKLKRCLVALNWAQEIKNYKEILIDPKKNKLKSVVKQNIDDKITKSTLKISNQMKDTRNFRMQCLKLLTDIAT